MFRGLYALLVLATLAGAGTFWAGRAALATPNEPAATDRCSDCCNSAETCDICGDPSCPLGKVSQDCAACCASGCPDCAAAQGCPVCGADCCPCCGSCCK